MMKAAYEGRVRSLGAANVFTMGNALDLASVMALADPPQRSARPGAAGGGGRRYKDAGALLSEPGLKSLHAEPRFQSLVEAVKKNAVAAPVAPAG